MVVAEVPRLVGDPPQTRQGDHQILHGGGVKWSFLNSDPHPEC